MPLPAHNLLAPFDPAGRLVWNPAVIADMAQLLVQPDVQWYEIEELLRAYPLETRFVQIVRSTQSRSPFFFGHAPSTDFTVDEDARQILIRQIFPFATLLDTHLTPLEQVAQLQREGVDVETFCRWIQAHHSVYRQAGRAALTAWEDHYSLLRGSERRPEPSGELLRTASGAGTAANALLSPTDKPASPTLPRPGWWQRWRSKT